MASLSGTSGDDQIFGPSSDDRLFGLNGDDILSGRNGEDELYGGDGDDILRGGRDEDSYIGGPGSDIYFGAPVFDDSEDSDLDFARYDLEEGGTRGIDINLRTGIGVDPFGDTDFLFDIEVVYATSLDDRLIGGNAANDYFEVFAGLAGNDTIDGGSGFDEARYDRDARAGGTAGILANMKTGIIRDGFGDLDTVSGIERVRGTASVDRMIGDGGDNRFRGLDGADTFLGGGGTDEIDYARDHDNGGREGVDVNLGRKRGVDGFGQVDRLVSVEDVRATRYDDTVVGNGAGNRIRLDDGDDLAKGQGGNDYLSGQNGHDTLIGGGGNDTLNGWQGKDVLTGGNGADHFVFEEVMTGRDRITDFGKGADKLVFHAEHFLFEAEHELARGDDFFVARNKNASTAEGPSFVYQKAQGKLWFDFDGRGDVEPVLVATLTNRPVLDASDLALVDLFG